MINFWKIIFGIFLTLIGILIFAKDMKDQRKNGIDKYGANFQVISSAILFAIIGVMMLVRELMKL